MKERMKVRMSNCRKMEQVSSMFSNVAIDDKNYGLPEIRLSSKCGGLFG
jgi:hypothetical protein